MIELRTIGTAEIHTGSATVTPSQEVVFAAALYLILERGTSVSRRHLSSLLWPKAVEKVRAHRLRQTLHQLKKLGILVRADRYKLELSNQPSFSDFDAIGSQIEQLAGRKCSIDFLAGYVPRLSEGLRDWVDARRAEVHAAIGSALVHSLEAARNRGDWATVETIASKCLTLDPYNETAVLGQAEAAAMRGSKKKAVSILDQFLFEIGEERKELRVPARVLRSRIVERLPDSSGRRRDEPPFVGREKEMELLVHRLAEARCGRGGAVLVTGEAGIGKSRLSAELGRFALLQGCQVEQTACQRGDVDRPLSLFVDIVPRLRELPGALGCAPETFALLKRLTDFMHKGRDEARSADSDALYTSVRGALFDLLDSIADERHLLILVDDVQWLDDQSARILARMAEWARSERVLFLLNTRPGENHLLEYIDQSQLPTISLGPLARGPSDSLLRSIALQPDVEIDTEFANWCLSVAEGNPFFLQELAHQWIETGHKHEAPNSVTTLLERRMLRLSTEALQVLQTSAVLADHSSLNRIEAVLGLQAYQLLSAIEELNGCAMLRPSAESLGGSPNGIQPKHELVSSTALSRLSPVSLAFLHGRSADVLERDIAQDIAPTTLLWACANHRHRAGDKEHALSLSLSCAEHLLAVGLGKESSEAFEKSLEYCSTDEQRLKVLPRLAFALQACEEWTRSKETLGSSVRLNAKVNPSPCPHNEYELLLLEARYYSSLEFTQLLKDLTPCVESADASPGHKVRACVTALKLATDIGPADIVDTLYQHVAPIIHCEDVLEQDALEVELVYRTMRNAVVPVEALRRFLSVGRPSSLDYFNRLLTVVSACRLSGRYFEGLQFLDETLAYAKSHGLTNRLHQAHTAAVQLHLLAEQYELAEATLREIQRHPSTPENPRMHAEPSYLEARIALEKKDLRRCKAALEKIVMVPSSYSASRRAYYFALQVALKVGEGASAESVKPHVLELEEAQSRIVSIGLKDFETFSLFIGLTALGQGDEAINMLRNYVSSQRRSRWPLSRKIKAALDFAENRAPSTERGTNGLGSQETAALRTDPLSGVV